MKLKSSARAGGFVWMYSPLLACCNGNLFWCASTTTAAVIPCKGTLDDSTLSLLPFPIDDSGQPLFSLEATPPHTGQVLIKEDSEEAVLAGHNTGPPAVNGDGAQTLSLRARVCLNRLLLHLFLACHTQPLGRIPFPFLPSPLPSFLHLLFICLLSSRLVLFLPPPPIPACASCVTSLSSSSPSSSRTMFCAMSFLN